jgi:hypothetical protein
VLHVAPPVIEMERGGVREVHSATELLRAQESDTSLIGGGVSSRKVVVKLFPELEKLDSSWLQGL